MTHCELFLKEWELDPNEMTFVFKRFKQMLESLDGVQLSFKARPNVSYSLRGVCPEHQRDLFVMVDVVDDDPAERWLSVCFYDDQVTDVNEFGDWVPEGLNGLDARCFDISAPDEELVAYTENRIREAWQAARGIA